MLSVMCSGRLSCVMLQLLIIVFTVSFLLFLFVAFLLSRCYHNVVNEDDYKNTQKKIYSLKRQREEEIFMQIRTTASVYS